MQPIPRGEAVVVHAEAPTPQSRGAGDGGRPPALGEYERREAKRDAAIAGR